MVLPFFFDSGERIATHKINLVSVLELPKCGLQEAGWRCEMSMVVKTTHPQAINGRHLLLVCRLFSPGRDTLSRMMTFFAHNKGRHCYK